MASVENFRLFSAAGRMPSLFFSRSSSIFRAVDLRDSYFDNGVCDRLNILAKLELNYYTAIAFSCCRTSSSSSLVSAISSSAFYLRLFNSSRCLLNIRC